ncbi:class I SAM-dependent methyltransferase [Neorhizobium sp. Rsf11]|uniref:Class I SAM-dependent methyltransferase n=1 Tax=Neorhizobium phenanthreniclasticum TaxID=3157917 RepID=A0ABV0M641_9HYPH
MDYSKALPLRLAISSADAVGDRVTVCGWRLGASADCSLEFFDEQGLKIVGELTTDIRRDDVAKSFPDYKEASAGWTFAFDAKEVPSVISAKLVGKSRKATADKAVKKNARATATAASPSPTGELRTALEKINKGIENIVENTVKPFPKVSAWLDTPPNGNHALFKELSDRALKRTADIVEAEMSDALLFFNMREFHEYCLSRAPREGAHCEFGVFSGKTINLFAKLRPDITFHGFDSFEGLPNEWTGWQHFDFNKSGKTPPVEANVELHVGWFNETLPTYVEGIEGTAFLHIDCDIYSSTRDIFQALKPKITSGTVILFDEYFCYPGFEKHERLAFKELLEETGRRADWFAVCGQRAACVIQ